MSSGWARTALSHRICTGIGRRKLGKLIEGLAGPWMAAEEDRLRGRRGHERLRAAGAGPDHQLAFTGRVIVTLAVLRFQLPHAVLAALYEVDRSTVTRAVREVRPLLAARGFAVPGEPGVRLRSGAFSSATSDDAKTSTRPTWPSPAWSPTAPPNGNHQQDNPPGQYAPTSIAHYAVRARR